MNELIILLSVILGNSLYKSIRGYILFKGDFDSYMFSHYSEFIMWDSGVCFLGECDLKYYNEITVKQTGEGSFQLVFWGNRDSWLWRFKRDKVFDINVEYKKSRGESVFYDEVILGMVNNLKGKENGKRK